MNHKRIMLIGPCGAGKSTFSKRLQKSLQIPIIHLDQYYWKPHWEETPIDEWNEKVRELAMEDSWIIDGNYTSSMDVRIERADLIIYLHQSTFILLYRVTKRIVFNYQKKRSDMAEGCKERFNYEFYQFVATFNKVRRPEIMKKLKNVKGVKQVRILKNKREINHLLESLT
jgi:adenylate kinase family enzyme